MLMVSGIGPKKTLESLGVKVLSDRPGVGQNLWVCFANQHLVAASHQYIRTFLMIYLFITRLNWIT